MKKFDKTTKMGPSEHNPPVPDEIRNFKATVVKDGKRSGVRTAAQIYSDELEKSMDLFPPISPVTLVLNAMNIYATQVAEAIRNECAKQCDKSSHPSLSIFQININDFIK